MTPLQGILLGNGDGTFQTPIAYPARHRQQRKSNGDASWPISTVMATPIWPQLTVLLWATGMALFRRRSIIPWSATLPLRWEI